MIIDFMFKQASQLNIGPLDHKRKIGRTDPTSFHIVIREQRHAGERKTRGNKGDGCWRHGATAGGWVVSWKRKWACGGCWIWIFVFF